MWYLAGNIGGQFLQVYHQRKLCFQVWKTLEEIKLVLQNGIRQLPWKESNLNISSVASSMNTLAPIAIRINPDVDAQTMKIATGKAENKFGIPL